MAESGTPAEAVPKGTRLEQPVTIARPIFGLSKATDSGSQGQMLDVSDIPYSKIVVFNNSGGTIYLDHGPSMDASHSFPLLNGAAATFKSNSPQERVRLKDVFFSGLGSSGLNLSWWAL